LKSLQVRAVRALAKAGQRPASHAPASLVDEGQSPACPWLRAAGTKCPALPATDSQKE